MYLRYQRPEKRISHSGSKTDTGRQEDDVEVVTHSKEGQSSSVGDQGYYGYNLILKLTNSRYKIKLNREIRLSIDLTPFKQRKNDNQTNSSNKGHLGKQDQMSRKVCYLNFRPM